MIKIRVLIIDDSVVARRVLSDIVAGSGLEVAGTAASGSLGLQKIPQVNPDVVILDCEMPDLSGQETLVAIRRSYPALPVIMFSTNSEHGAAATVDALSRGASDFVTKPSSLGDSRTLVNTIAAELVRKIKTLVTREQPVLAAAPAPVVSPRTLSQRVDVVALGCSTGGPAALAEVLPQIGAQLPVPIVLVQHMPPMFTRTLAERLTLQAGFPVHEATSGMPLIAGHAYVAPGNFHMVTRRVGNAVSLQLHQAPPENSCRPAVDVLFRSVAETFGSATLGVVLTGMGQDGLRGCEHLNHAGGIVWAQDEATSVVWGMPGFVARSGLAQKILPLQAIGAAIRQRVSERRPEMQRNTTLTSGAR